MSDKDMSGDPDVQLRRSIAQAAAGDLTAAETTVRALLSEQPDYPPAYLHLARVLLARARPDEAVSSLRTYLARFSDMGGHGVEALLLLADAELRAGRPAEAEALARRALVVAPRNAQAMFALALVHQQTGRFAEAVTLFDDVLRTYPGTFAAWVNKGLAEKQLGRLDDAIASFLRALSLNPVFAPAHYSLGLIHLALGARGEAEHSFRKALEADPRHIHAAMQLATLLRYENRPNEAADVYRTVLEYDPANAVARFHVDLLRRPGCPARVPADVVRATYASGFVGRDLEQSLRDNLQYQTPTILEQALSEIYGVARATLDVLDLGCGSGLFGALVRPKARRVVGVDLSAAMIEECRRKGVYDSLHVGDVVDYLGQTPDRFDLIVAMDVFCYFGDLRPLFHKCAGVLRPGGTLACSVERSPDDKPWEFHRYGHFVHSAAHLRDAAAGGAMREVRMTECALRRELGEDRVGFVALFSRNT
jgi:predicted TPR repeat methyltransferase